MWRHVKDTGAQVYLRVGFYAWQDEEDSCREKQNEHLREWDAAEGLCFLGGRGGVGGKGGEREKERGGRVGGNKERKKK